MKQEKYHIDMTVDTKIVSFIRTCREEHEYYNISVGLVDWTSHCFEETYGQKLVIEDRRLYVLFDTEEERTMFILRHT